MHPCGGCWAARRLLASPAPPPASDQSMDAQRAHLERVLGATTIVLFVASVTYIALSTFYAYLRVASTPPGGNDDPAPGTREDTKRALDGIPVRMVVQHSRDGDGGRKGADEVVAREVDLDAVNECAVCLAEYAAGDEVRVLPACRHGFHRECVDRWLLTRAPTCPVCRAPVAAPVEDADASKEDCASRHDGIAVDRTRVSVTAAAPVVG